MSDYPARAEPDLRNYLPNAAGETRWRIDFQQWQIESLSAELFTIRREVGASDRCVSRYKGVGGVGPICGETAEQHCGITIPSPDDHGCERWHHPFTPEPTLAAVQRAMKERMSDDACEQAALIVSNLCAVPSGQFTPIGDLIMAIKQARGTGAKS